LAVIVLASLIAVPAFRSLHRAEREVHVVVCALGETEVYGSFRKVQRTHSGHDGTTAHDPTLFEFRAHGIIYTLPEAAFAAEI
jgi:hypothetical protein